MWQPTHHGVRHDPHGGLLPCLVLFPCLEGRERGDGREEGCFLVGGVVGHEGGVRRVDGGGGTVQTVLACWAGLGWAGGYKYDM